MSTATAHVQQIAHAHVFHTRNGYPDAQTGTCACGYLSMTITRAEHAAHIHQMQAQAIAMHVMIDNDRTQAWDMTDGPDLYRLLTAAALAGMEARR